ncbi:agamous-like MADS-box protein AGL62 [Bidens hawaiensis]|uniref:agamous-like MADS-box protein AGL62 n=1 Tax=Bidens hawaiensis TaxID=980011 RepID=UPI00404B77BD
MNNKKKTTKGRKKIEIKKIEEANSRQVTFSKRRTGLFKKASELCILTGAQVAIIVTSPGGRVFAFGHPKVETVVDRYLNNNNNNNNATTSTGYNNQYSSPPPLPAQEFNQHYTEVSRELEAEKKRREMIPSSSSSLPWFERPTEGMDVGELDLFLWSLLELRRKVLTRADELMMINRPQQHSSAAAAGPNVLFDQMRWNNYVVNAGQMTAGHVPTNDAGGFVFQHHGIGGSGDQILPKFLGFLLLF